MAAVGQQPSLPAKQGERRKQASVTQLEFNQAMSDFKTMFPDMDLEVIEIVLRANNGTVDPTIDQLLAMSTDNENEKIRTELDATENDELPPSYKPATPPPSYHQAVPFAQGSSRRSSSQSPSLLRHSGTGGQKLVLPPGKRDLVGSLPRLSLEKLGGAVGGVEVKERRRKWNPPLVGPLPATFLRLEGQPVQQRKGSLTLSSAMIQKRMQENERQRRNTISADDPELAQYLEDERFALFLQNEEFLQELMGNQEFLFALEKDASGKSSTLHHPRNSHVYIMGERSHPEAESSKDDEHLRIPHALSADDTDAAFREKLKNMGKLSRRKFAQLASLFSRRKRAFKPILGDGTNPSRDNLLSHEDEYSELSEDDSDPDWNKKDSWNSHHGNPCEKSVLKNQLRNDH